MTHTTFNTMQRTALCISMLLIANVLRCAPFVYVGNNGSNSVSVIDAATNEVITTVNLGTAPDVQIAITTDGKTVWVPCFDGTTGTVQLIDVATNTLLPEIVIGSGQVALGVAMSPDGLYAYVVSYAAPTGYITQFNTTTKAIVSTVSGAFEPLTIFITPDGKTAYIGDGSDTILPVDLTTNPPTLGTQVHLVGTGAFAISPDSAYLYANSETPNHYVAQYNISNANRLAPFPLNTISYPTIVPFQPTGLAMTSDGKTLYVASGSIYFNAIGTINISNPASPTTGTVVTDATINGPLTIALSSDDNSLYVVSQLDDMTNVINTSSPLNPTFKTSVSVGTHPISLAITPGSSSAPTNVSGCKTQNVFLLQTDYINKLSWSAPATGSPVAYNIYRDATLTDLAGSSSSLEFYDHGRNPSVIYSYYITSVDGSGNQSTAASVTVTSPC